LRKTVAYFLGVLLAFTLGYVLLDPALLIIADWLGPMFGSSLLTLLATAFLLLGDPLRFAALSALWGGVAFLGGLIIRRRVGAILTMISVFLFFVPILAASIFNIVQTVSELLAAGGVQDPFTLLPPLPRGLSLATLMEAPIIGRVFEQLMGFMETGGPEGPQEVLTELVTPLMIDFAEKIVIICFAALVGAEVGKRIEGRFAPWSEALRIKLGGKPRPGSATVTAVSTMLTIFLLLVAAPASVSFTPGAAASDDGFFSENLLGFVDEDGGAYVVDLFLDSEMSVGGVDMGSLAGEGLLAAVFVSHDSLLDNLPETGMPEGFDIGSITSLMPPTALIVIYVDVPPEAAGERAEVISSAFSDAFDTSLSQLMAFSPPISNESGVELPPISIVMYQSSAELSEVADALLGQIPVERGGLAEVVEEAFENGRLIPGSTPDSADGTMFFTGFINLAMLSSYVPMEELDRFNVSSLLPSFDAPLGLSGGVSFWENGVQAMPDNIFDPLHLLGVEAPVSFSSDAALSNVLIVAPNQTQEAGPEGQQVAKLTTSAPLADPQFAQMMREQGVRLTVAPPGSTLGSSSFQIIVSAPMPLNVQVAKQATPQVAPAGGEVQVAVTVRNDDDRPMEEVVLDDSASIQGYQMSVAIISGSTTGTWSVLRPGESRTLTYTLRLGSGGVYTLRPASVQYLHEGRTFSASSDSVEIRVPRPSAAAFVAGSVAASWAATAEALDVVTGGNGSTVLTASTLASLALLAFAEIRNFKKWLAGG